MPVLAVSSRAISQEYEVQQFFLKNSVSSNSLSGNINIVCKQLTVEIEFNFHRSKNVVTTQVYAERQNICPVSTSQKEFRVTLKLKHYPTLKLHNTAWQEIVTTLAAQNKVLRRRFSCSTRKTAPRKSKSVCVRQASEQPERKSTDCVKCYKEKKK